MLVFVKARAHWEWHQAWTGAPPTVRASVAKHTCAGMGCTHGLGLVAVRGEQGALAGGLVQMPLVVWRKEGDGA